MSAGRLSAPGSVSIASMTTTIILIELCSCRDVPVRIALRRSVDDRDFEIKARPRGRPAETTIRILETRGEKADGPLVSRFLEANNPGVVKTALQTLDRLDPNLARSRAEAALEREDLHAESQRALVEYLG